MLAPHSATTACAHRRAPNPRRGFQFDKHLLRTILKVPTAMHVSHVIAANELDQLVMLEL
jgi:hypothetical protein